MAITQTVDAAFLAAPAALDDLSEGAERIQESREASHERLAVEHYGVAAGTQSRHGRHLQGSAMAFVGQTAPTPPTPDGAASVSTEDYKGRLFIRTLDASGEIPESGETPPDDYLKAQVHDGEGWKSLAYLDTVSDETLLGVKTFGDRPKINESLGALEAAETYERSLELAQEDVPSRATVEALMDYALVGMICAFAEDPNEETGTNVMWVYCDGTDYGGAAYDALRASHPAWTGKGKCPYIAPDYRDKFIRGASASAPIQVTSHAPSPSDYHDAVSQNKKHAHLVVVPAHSHDTNDHNGVEQVSSTGETDLAHAHVVGRDENGAASGSRWVDDGSGSFSSSHPARTGGVVGFLTNWWHKHVIGDSPEKYAVTGPDWDPDTTVDADEGTTTPAVPVTTYDVDDVGDDEGRPKSEVAEYWMYIGHALA